MEVFWNVVAIAFVGIIFLLLIFTIVSLISSTMQVDHKVDIVDDNVNDVVVIVQDLAYEDKIKVVLVWDEGRVEVKGRRKMDQCGYDLKKMDKLGYNSRLYKNEGCVGIGWDEDMRI